MTVAQMIQNTNIINSVILYIAFELSNTKWKLAFSDGVKRRFKTIDARDMNRVYSEIDRAKKHFSMGENTTIHTCYEAGRDGFWIHRHLVEHGVNNIVVDSSSIEVNRRYRRAKTDRIDASKLLNMLIRYLSGETKLWSVVRVPNVAQEDERRLHREIERLKKEKTSHSNRITSLLILQGIKTRVDARFLKRLEHFALPDGQPLPIHLKNEILREHERYELIKNQLKQLEAEKKQMLDEGGDRAQKVQMLQNFKGIGPISAWLLVYEYFGWRQFDNVKQVGAAAGLAPTPYDSGSSIREQGISKAGNRRIRAVMIELAWYWLRYQPKSELSQWYMHRFGTGSKRMRRVGIVALARKLLISLWKYTESQVIPEGAMFKNAA